MGGDLKQKLKEIRITAGISLAIIATIGTIVKNEFEDRESRIKNHFQLCSDLNQDGTNDAIYVDVEKKYITPYFGRFNGTNIIYTTKWDMQRTNTNDYFTYEKLEKELNREDSSK